MVYGVQNMVYAVQNMVYGVQNIVYGVQNMLYGVQNMLYGVCCTLYVAGCTVCSLRYTGMVQAKKADLAKNCLRVLLRTMCWRKYQVVFKECDIS